MQGVTWSGNRIATWGHRETESVSQKYLCVHKNHRHSILTQGSEKAKKLHQTRPITNTQMGPGERQI